MTRKTTLQYLLFGCLLLPLLAGCSGGPILAFSPESAAVLSARNYQMPEFTVHPNTIQMLQKQVVGSHTIALVSFQGMRATSGLETCLFTFEVRQSRIGGWESAGGGGGCFPDVQKQTEPITISGGSGSGGTLLDPGYSSSEGRVYQNDITAVQITWKDNTVTIVPVVNNSYLALRAGQLEMMKVEGLNTDQQVVYTWERNVAPGKE